MYRTVYLVVTNDEYETPVFEALTLTEIAKRLKMHLTTITRAFSRKGTVCKRKYKIIVTTADVEPKYILRLKKNSTVIGHFKTQRELAEYLGVPHNSVWRACNKGSVIKGKYKVRKNKALIP